MNNERFWIKNVTIESGYIYEDNVVVGTETEVCHILIENGKVAKIADRLVDIVDDFPQYDVKNLLMLPSYQEMHIHIDKTYYGGPWKACTPFANIFTRINEEQELLPHLLPTAKERAEKMLDLLVKKGNTHIRTHCNIDQVVGLKNLEATVQALEAFKGKLSSEIVAFPQHGLLRSQSVELVRQAMKEGANLVGGVDPATVDEDIERSLQTMMELAVEADADIDVHLHDPGHLGIFTFKRLAAITEDAGWQGRVTISHAIGLGDISVQEASEVADMFARLGISITSTVPMRVTMNTPPLPLLRDHGVPVYLGNDSITDHWSPFGTGDNLERVNQLADYFRLIDEKSLAETLGFITGGKTPLDQLGNRIWPRIGDEANAVFVDAGCSAQAVARRAEHHAVMYQGNVVAGSLSSIKGLENG